MRTARAFATEAARLRDQGLTYNQIIASWCETERLNPLTAARLAHGLTQQQVCDRWNQLWPDPDRPKTAKTISYWETGTRQPGRVSLHRLATLYRCSPGLLFCGTPQPTDGPSPCLMDALTWSEQLHQMLTAAFEQLAQLQDQIKHDLSEVAS